MLFTGTFNTYDNQQTYSVSIGDTSSVRIVNIIDPLETTEDDTIVMFGPRPVTISCDRQDLSKRIIISQAVIELVSNDELTDELFADTDRTIPVSIGLNSTTIFYGYVDPLQFNQGYAHRYETITINATDPLGALENITVDKLPNVTTATEMTPWNLIVAILNKAGITGTINDSINATVKTAMQNTKLHMIKFFGEDKDDYFNCYEILESVCKYFNLYIAMNGPNSVILTGTINNAPVAQSLALNAIATDDSTSLSTDDIYSQVNVTCKIDPVEDLITSFDNEDNLYSDYNAPVKYMTEYVSPGEGVDAWTGFKNVINDEEVHYEAVYTVDQFAYAFRNDKWDFGTGSKSYIEALGGSINHETGAKTKMTSDQKSLLTWLAQAPCKCALVGFGSSDKLKGVNNRTSTTPEANVTIDKYLVISSMGQFANDSTTLNNYSTILNNSQPLCKFMGIDDNVLTPADSGITNFILISGNILLNPLQRLTGPYFATETQKLTNYWNVCKNAFDYTGISAIRGCWHNTVPYEQSSDGAYYNQKWYSGTNGVYGYLNNSENKMLKYKYSTTSGGRDDRISKMPVVACQMKVGTGAAAKYCVEKLWLGDEGKNSFAWMTQAELDALATQLGYTVSPSFTLGIDPNIDDFIIGQKYQIASTANYALGLNTTGMAIPIKVSDHLSGPIEFSILGPYNSVFRTYTEYYHGWWFWEHVEGYDPNDNIILGNIQSIMLNNLKIELTSDNGGINANKSKADNDLVYASNMNPIYIEKLEEDFEICTPPTLQQCVDNGIKVQTSNSYVFKLNDEPFLGFQSGENIVRPEECYVDYMYKEYSEMSKILQTQVKATAFSNGINGNLLNNDMLSKYYTGLDIGNCRLMSYNTDLKYKTIDAIFRQHKTVSNEQI